MQVMSVTWRIAVHSLRAEASEKVTGDRMQASRTRMGVRLVLLGTLCGCWFESLVLRLDPVLDLSPAGRRHRATVT